MQDAPEIARVHVASWQRIYRGHFPDSYLDALGVGRRAALWREVLRDRFGKVAVAELDGRIVGFVSIADSRDADAPSGTGELTAIYLDPGYWRRGLGSELMSWVARSARECNWRRMTLWVLRDNRQARVFYEAMGWQVEGAEQVEVIGDVDAWEVRYILEVAA